ncbi:MAG: SAM-dependent methyltransferase [Planctomycetes bacterium]|nr:SAM-dependent methyltransferase [Planctomycetota bacterium]
MEGFEAKYRDASFARRYRDKRRRSWVGRISDRVEQRLAGRALRVAGRVDEILDCPCGAGRFWPTLARYCEAVHAADQSADMLAAGREGSSVVLQSAIVARAESLPHESDAVDLVFSSRLLHHVADADDRVRILQSFARVSRRWVVFSTWETGNRTHSRHRRRDARRPRPSNRVFLPMETIRAEVVLAGMRVVRVLHKLRGISPLVMVVCEREPAA